MIVKLECGCTINDEVTSTVHSDDGRHYPLNCGPKSFCLRCDLFKPCLCSTDRKTDSI